MLNIKNICIDFQSHTRFESFKVLLWLLWLL